MHFEPFSRPSMVHNMPSDLFDNCSMSTSSTHVVCIENVVDGDLMTALQRDCSRLQNLIKRDATETGASLDPFEYVNLSPLHPARIQQSAYLKARFLGNEDCQKPFEQLIFQVFPTLLRRILLVPPSEHLYLFNEHFVVKEAGSGVAFRWHRDCDEQLQAINHLLQNITEGSDFEYYSIWCPLDDVFSENGTLAFPVSADIEIMNMSNLRRCLHAQSSFPLPDNENDDDEGMDDFGQEVHLPAGSIVVFPHNLPHRSGVNHSSTARRVFYAQYSLHPIQSSDKADDRGVLSFAVPC